MSKINIKNENVLVVFTISAMLAMGAISAAGTILPTRLLYAQEDSQEFVKNHLGKQRFLLLRLRLLEMQLLNPISRLLNDLYN